MFSLPTKSFWAGNHSPQPSEWVQGHQDNGIGKEGIFTIQVRDLKWITIFIPHGSIAFKYRVLQWSMPCEGRQLVGSVCCCLFLYLSEWAFCIYTKGRKLWNICDRLKHKTVEQGPSHNSTFSQCAFVFMCSCDFQCRFPSTALYLIFWDKNLLLNSENH